MDGRALVWIDAKPHLRIEIALCPSRFRPVPLTQTFIGIKTTNKSQQLADMDRVCFEKVLDEVKKGEQVSGRRAVRLKESGSVRPVIGASSRAADSPKRRSENNSGGS